MAYNLRYSPLALKDLDEIYDYIACRLENPSAADHTLDGILSAIERLKEFPETGAVLYSVLGMETDYRFIIYKNYMAFYRHVENTVFIDRIIYGKRDYLRILFAESDEDL